MKRRLPTSTVLVLAACLAGALRMTAHPQTTTAVTWDREIQPIVQARCSACHSEGARTTMSLATYESARPWARAIRHQVLTRRMPVWHAARGYGDFSNDPSLSPFEISLIVAWVDGGAPKTIASRTVPPLAAISAGAPRALLPAPSGHDVTVNCDGRPVAAGLLAGVRPQLDRGGSLRLWAALADGRREVLGWFRDFDPDDATTYWLRTPMTLTPGARVLTEVASSASCSVVLVMK